MENYREKKRCDDFMKRFWLVQEEGQYAVYDSKEKTRTDWVDLEQIKQKDHEELILELRNSLERHDEEIGDIEDVNGHPLVHVVAQSDLD